MDALMLGPLCGSAVRVRVCTVSVVIGGLLSGGR